jgi:hypothetical protein
MSQYTRIYKGTCSSPVPAFLILFIPVRHVTY